METQYDLVASERVAQTIASKRIYDQLYPPPAAPNYEDSDSKQTKRYLWVLYLAAVIFSSVHTVPGLLERVPDMMIFSEIGLNLKHIAGAAAFVMYEIGLMTIPYIIFRYLTDSAEAGKAAREFMRKSLYATVGLVVAVLIMLNIYTTWREGATSEGNQENVVLAASPTVAANYALKPEGNILQDGMWAIVAISPVFVAVVSGMGLALMKSHQQAKESALRASHNKLIKDHEMGFRNWDGIQQRHSKGAYLATRLSTSNSSNLEAATKSLLADNSQPLETNSRNRSASSLILSHLQENPQDAKANVQDLARRLKQKPSTVSKYQRVFRDHQKREGE